MIKEEQFKTIFSNNKFHLPYNLNKNMFFLDRINNLFNDYKKIINEQCEEYNNINEICNKLVEVIEKYLEGLPSDAFNLFSDLMKVYYENLLYIYNKSICDEIETLYFKDPLKLYRIRNGVNEKNKYEQSEIFHVPYDLCSNVSACRYSIAGYPGLYLGTNLELCSIETGYNRYRKPSIAARFQLNRNINNNGIRIGVIDLAIKPQDYFEEHEYNYNNSNKRFIEKKDLNKIYNMDKYLIMYPLIASCSFIRSNSKTPFSPEYIIPQLLMQWVRKKYSSEDENHNLVGIRYFSCKSIKASDMGFNYVFPTKGKTENSKFCNILSKAFFISKIHCLNKSKDLEAYKNEMDEDNNFRELDL